MRVFIWLIRLLKRREFWFCMLVYPALFLAARWLKTGILYDVSSSYPLYYGLAIFVISIMVVIFTLLEVVSRLWGHGLQGRKLHIRTDAGVDFEDLSL